MLEFEDDVDFDLEMWYFREREFKKSLIKFVVGRVIFLLVLVLRKMDVVLFNGFLIYSLVL